MSMHDIKVMLSDILYGLMLVIIGLEMSRPWHIRVDERPGKKRNELCRRSGIPWGKQRYIMPLHNLFLYQIVKHNLGATIVFWRNRDPRRSYMRNFHNYPLPLLTTKPFNTIQPKWSTICNQLLYVQPYQKVPLLCNNLLSTEP